MAGVIPARREIPVEYTWDVTSIFASDEAWEAEIRRVREQLEQVGRFRDHLGPHRVQRQSRSFPKITFS